MSEQMHTGIKSYSKLRKLEHRLLSDALGNYRIGESVSVEELANSAGLDIETVRQHLPLKTRKFGFVYDRSTDSLQRTGEPYFRPQEDSRPKMGSDSIAGKNVLSAIEQYSAGSRITAPDLARATGYRTASISAFMNSLRHDETFMQELGFTADYSLGRLTFIKK